MDIQHPCSFDVEAKLRHLLVELGNADEILGIQVHQVFNLTSGMHNALADLIWKYPILLCNWDECLNCIVKTVPEGSPGQQQLYHYVSFSWLCGRNVEDMLIGNDPLSEDLNDIDQNAFIFEAM